ncbi:MAG: uroporphyrinogen decarboxylase family protein [Massiliimalia sp.]|jgi:hypothetical protein
MKAKNRLLNALLGKPVDRIPWSPFLAYYWDYLPESIQCEGQVSYLEKMGADPLLRGFHCLSKLKYNNCEISEQVKQNEKQVVYETPVGILKERYTYSPKGNTWFLTDHPVKTGEDIKILQCLIEHCQVIQDTDIFNRDFDYYGDRALLLPVVGLFSKTAFQSMLEHWMGTEELIYAIYDIPEVLEECLAAIQEKDFQTVEIAAQTKAEGFIFWEDSSTTNISPQLFSRYTAPEITRWGNYLHKNDKLLVHHACGHLKDLIPEMAKLPVDAIESISPPPTGNIELWEAYERLPQTVALIGGIEPTVFRNETLEGLEQYVERLLNKTKGKRFILANSDSCPPDVEYTKFRYISELVRETCI